MKLIICVLTVLTSAQLAFGQARSAYQELETDLLASVVVLDRNINIYHYFFAPKNELIPSELHPSLNTYDRRNNWALKYTQTRPKVFWDLDYATDRFINAGPGMYLALDPASSQEFGDAAVVMTIPINTRYISVYDPIPLRLETKQALVAEGIIEDKQLLAAEGQLGLNKGFSRDTLKFMVRPENRKFRELVNYFFSSQNIFLIEYRYKSYLAGFCNSARQTSFNYIGSVDQVIVTPTVQLFTQLEFKEKTMAELNLTDKTRRFREALLSIRERGVNQAQTILAEKLSPEEINYFIQHSHMCEMRP